MRTTSLAVMAVLSAAAAPCLAQDLYDPTVLRTVNLQFHDSNWLTLLPQNYQSQTNILADLTVEGVTYPNVGVRIRGNTSYTQLPAGSQKWSLNVTMDFVDPTQRLMSYDSLNFNNGHRDPTFCREVTYNNIVAKYMPNGRANHILLTLNGANWGVYINVQQYDKRMLGDHFANTDGMRLKCANNPNGPGLVYNGTTQAGYPGYEMKDTGGLTTPWATFGAECYQITSGSTTNWAQIDAQVAIDPSSWSVALENLLTDDDSYSNKGADFVVFRDPISGRMHLHQTDANETWTQTSWAPTRNFTATAKPFLSHVLGIPEMRQRYLAHYRTMQHELTWAVAGPEFLRLRDMIAVHVQADPKKLYTYQNFLDNFTTTVNLGSGMGGGSVVGLQQFCNTRASYLNTVAELTAQGPVIGAVEYEPLHPEAGEQVWVTAAVSPSTSAVQSVQLYYRPGVTAFSRVAMLDDGTSHDGAAGDGVYGAALPVNGVAGQLVPFYVSATAANTYGTLTFSPAGAENGPAWMSVGFGSSGVRITELMYNGLGGEFVEITNLSNQTVDMTGWSTDDADGVAGTTPLSGAGFLMPGQSFVLTDADPAAFASAWGLSGVAVVGPNLTGEFGRNDAIHLFDASGTLVDRLRYGDEEYPGTAHTSGVSAITCTESFGDDDIGSWSLVSAGDGSGAWANSLGDIGSPGIHVAHSCNAPSCVADLDGNGAVDGLDMASLLGNWGVGGPPDFDGSGTVDGNDLATLLGSWGACP